ncbi:unnamed protein product, partial [Sphacelaria rigidula]
RGGEGTVDGRKLRRVMDLFSFLGIGEGGQTIPVVEKIDASDGRSPVGSGGDSVDYSGGRGMFDSDFSGAASPAATDGAVATASQRAPSRSPPVAAVPRGTDGLVEQTRGDAVAVQNSGVVEQRSFAQALAPSRFSLFHGQSPESVAPPAAPPVPEEPATRSPAGNNATVNRSR